MDGVIISWEFGVKKRRCCSKNVPAPIEPEGVDRFSGPREKADVKDGETRCAETPRPKLIAPIIVSGFIRTNVRFLDQGLAQFGIGCGEGG